MSQQANIEVTQEQPSVPEAVLEQDSKYYKVLNAELNHFGFQYKVGLNVDNKHFTRFPGEPNGMHYATADNLACHFKYGCYIADVKIPADAKTFYDKLRAIWKADKLEIVSYCKIEDHPLMKDPKWRSITAARCRHIRDCQQYNLSLEAVKQNGLALQFMIKQNDHLCMSAVKQNGLALEFVVNPTYTICFEAVKQNGLALQFVKNKTHNICMRAVKQNGLALEFVVNPVYTICVEAVKQNGLAMRYVKMPLGKYNICPVAFDSEPVPDKPAELELELEFV